MYTLRRTHSVAVTVVKWDFFYTTHPAGCNYGRFSTWSHVVYLFLKYTIQRNGIWCAFGRNSSVGCENVCNLGFSIA